jgi:hypothetical protein
VDGDRFQEPAFPVDRQDAYQVEHADFVDDPAGFVEEVLFPRSLVNEPVDAVQGGVEFGEFGEFIPGLRVDDIFPVAVEGQSQAVCGLLEKIDEPGVKESRFSGGDGQEADHPALGRARGTGYS